MQKQEKKVKYCSGMLCTAVFLTTKETGMRERGVFVSRGWCFYTKFDVKATVSVCTISNKQRWNNNNDIQKGDNHSPVGLQCLDFEL